MKTNLIVLTLCCCSITISAQNFIRLKNRWKPNEYIHVEQPNPTSSGIQPGWHSAQWVLEQEQGTPFYKIKNRWRNQYLHIETGPLVCGNIQPGWWSAQWQLEPVSGTSFYRLRNRWKPEVAMHNQNGMLEAGAIQLGWWSAMWELENANLVPTQSTEPNDVAITPQPPAQPAVQLVPTLPSSNDANAFKPQHGGKISVMFMRYTSLWPMADLILKPGDRIYFFPQRMDCNRTGLNFDADNPPLAGQTLIVQEVTPDLVFDKPIPMMRNQSNGSFSMIIEVY